MWRAFFIKYGLDGKPLAPLVIRDRQSIAINMEAGGGGGGGENEANIACMDDNFLIEVILAAFDFFRVSDTLKQD